MKQLYLTLAAAAAIAFSSFGAKAFTVDEIVGTYDATDMNLSENFGGIFTNGNTLAGLESVSWEMTISAVEGNKVKLTNFIKKGINDGKPDFDFAIEGDFDPTTNTITFQPTYWVYKRPGLEASSFFDIKRYVAKYDGVTEAGTNYPEEEQENKSFIATFDENKNLTVEPWAMLTTGFRVDLAPYYELNGEKKFGTYYTPKKSDPELTVNDIVGTYNATNMNLSENFGGIFTNGNTLAGLESVSWEMTISAVEGNKVKLTNFIKKGINDGKPDFDFAIEGDFDPQTKTITFQPTYWVYKRPGLEASSFFDIKRYVAKYDGVTEAGTNYPEEEQENKSFIATFDENKNLTVEPWAMLTTGFRVDLAPYYELNGEKKFGTYYTPAGQSGLDDIQVEEIEDENAPVEYFNLQGMKVENPENGMFIRRQGKKVQKVIIR